MAEEEVILSLLLGSTGNESQDMSLIVYESSRRSIILYVPINLVQFASNPPTAIDSYELLVVMTAA